jgi:hypothetical protein
MSDHNKIPPSPDTAFGPEGVKGRDSARKEIQQEMAAIRRMNKLDRAINRSMRKGGGSATLRLIALKEKLGGNVNDIAGNGILNTENIRNQAVENYRVKAQKRYEIGQNEVGNGGAPADNAQGDGGAGVGGAGVGGDVPPNPQAGADSTTVGQETATGSSSRLDDPIGSGRIEALNGSANSLEQQAADKSRQSALAGNQGKAAQDKAKSDMAKEFIDGADIRGTETPEILASMKKEMRKNLPPELSKFGDGMEKAVDQRFQEIKNSAEDSRAKKADSLLDPIRDQFDFGKMASDAGEERTDAAKFASGNFDNKTGKAVQAIAQEYGDYLGKNPKKESESQEAYDTRKQEVLDKLKGENTDALDKDGNLKTTDSAKEKGAAWEAKANDVVARSKQAIEKFNFKSLMNDYRENKDRTGEGKDLTNPADVPSLDITKGNDPNAEAFMDNLPKKDQDAYKILLGQNDNSIIGNEYSPAKKESPLVDGRGMLADDQPFFSDNPLRSKSEDNYVRGETLKGDLLASGKFISDQFDATGNLYKKSNAYLTEKVTGIGKFIRDNETDAWIKAGNYVTGKTGEAKTPTNEDIKLFAAEQGISKEQSKIVLQKKADSIKKAAASKQLKETVSNYSKNSQSGMPFARSLA